MQKIIKNFGLIVFVAMIIIGAFSQRAIAVDNLYTGPDGPSSSGPACEGTINDLNELLGFTVCAINNYLIPVAFTLGVVLFVWGIVQYFMNPENSTEREEANKFITWALVAFVVILGVWGFVGLLAGTFNLHIYSFPLQSQ